MRKCMCRRAQAHLRCAYGVTCGKQGFTSLGVPFAFPCKKECVGGKDWPREFGFGFLACVVCSQAILHVCLHVFCGCLIEFLYPVFQILHAQSGMQMDRCTGYTPKPTYHPPFSRLSYYIMLSYIICYLKLCMGHHQTTACTFTPKNALQDPAFQDANLV